MLFRCRAFSFSRLYEKVVESCAQENIPEETNRRLGKSCTPKDIETLIEKLESLDDADLENDPGDESDFYWRMRISLSDALVAAGDAAEEPLLRTLHSTNKKAAEYAARSLGLRRSKRAVETIIGKMKDIPDNAGKLSYISALGDIGDPRAIEALRPCLSRSGEQNGAWLVRLTAVALGKCGDSSVLKPLCHVLATDEEWFARLGAAEGLGHLNDTRALADLQLALNDRDNRVAKEAQASIRQIQQNHGN